MIELIGHTGYFIDEDGNAYSNKSINGVGKAKELRQLKLGKSVFGYMSLRVCIGKKGKIKSFLIHRLVAKAFIPNPENKPCVNHIDGNKSNNKISNLEWVTHSENMAHAKSKGLSKPPPLHIMRGSDNPNSPLKDEQVISMRDEYSIGNISQRALARKYNVKQSSIWKILNRKSWSHL